MLELIKDYEWVLELINGCGWVLELIKDCECMLEPRGMSGSSNYRLSLGVRMKSHG